MAAIDVISLLRFKARFSNAREFIFNLLDSSTIRGRSNKQRSFISVGVEGPLLYNFFYNSRGAVPKILKKFTFAYNYHIGNTISEGDDPDFGKELQMSWVVKFSLFFKN